MTLRVMLDVRGDDAARWRDALAAALAGATIVADDAAEADYLVAWRPAPDRFVRTRVHGAVFNLGAGVDALLSLPTLPAALPVYRLTDAGMGEQMAEYALAAVLRAYRELDAYAAQQRNAQWRPRPRIDKARFCVGILGMGVLGRTVAAAVRGAGFVVHGHARAEAPVAGVVMHAGDLALRDCLSVSHVCICLLPSTPATRNLLDYERLGWLPRGAHVVNMARGDIVVDHALIARLDEGHLAGATLDVFRDEPLPASHPFWHHRAITVTPHIAAVTLPEASAAQVATGIGIHAAGGEPPGRVDRVRGY